MIWTSPPIFTSIFLLHSLSCIRTQASGACPPGTTTAKSAWCPTKQVTISFTDQLVVTHLTYCRQTILCSPVFKVQYAEALD